MIREITIAGRPVGEGHPVFIIAEAGKNHNGDVGLAKELVAAAAETGVDAIKFQSYSTERLMIREQPKPQYFNETVASQDSVFDITKRLELSEEGHRAVAALAKEKGVLFMSTPEDPPNVDLLASLDVPVYKVSSLNITNTMLLRKIAAQGKPMIISTGMANLGEVAQAIDAVCEAGCDDIILLHCTALYPAHDTEVNLKAMVTMRKAFKMPVGYSDHTLRGVASLGAVALGACVIERHFTLDKNMDGPDQRLSADPKEMKELVDNIRAMENCIGSPIKRPPEREIESRNNKRRSVTSIVEIPEGTVIMRGMLDVKTPGTGIPANMLDMVVGKTARARIPADTTMTWEMI